MKAAQLDYIAKWSTFILGNVALGWVFITILMMVFLDFEPNVPATWLCIGWGGANMLANAYIDKYIRMVERQEIK